MLENDGTNFRSAQECVSRRMRFSGTITIIQYVVRFTERWGTVVVLSFSNAYNSVRMHESMHLVDGLASDGLALTTF